MNVEELRTLVNLDGSSHINIFFITSSWHEETFRGLATFPWEKNVYTSQGMYSGFLLFMGIRYKIFSH